MHDGFKYEEEEREKKGLPSELHAFGTLNSFADYSLRRNPSYGLGKPKQSLIISLIRASEPNVFTICHTSIHSCLMRCVFVMHYPMSDLV